MVFEICLKQELQNNSLESKMVALTQRMSHEFLELKGTNKNFAKDGLHFRCSDNVLLLICELPFLDV